MNHVTALSCCPLISWPCFQLAKPTQKPEGDTDRGLKLPGARRGIWRGIPSTEIPNTPRDGRLTLGSTSTQPIHVRTLQIPVPGKMEFWFGKQVTYILGSRLYPNVKRGSSGRARVKLGLLHWCIGW